MLKFGIKLWTSNSATTFQHAAELIKSGKFDFVELFFNINESLDYGKIDLVKSVPVDVHATYLEGFHEFKIGPKEQKIWREILKLADFLRSEYVIVHPGLSFGWEHFEKNLSKIDDSRVLIENMAGVNLFNQPTYGNTLEELEDIKKRREICFDFEKAVKSAIFHGKDYKLFITDCIKRLRPKYFHISGCDCDSPKDQHQNLWEAGFDLKWVKSLMSSLTKENEIKLVFETPKVGDDLNNDLKNLIFFKKL